VLTQLSSSFSFLFFFSFLHCSFFAWDFFLEFEESGVGRKKKKGREGLGRASWHFVFMRKKLRLCVPGLLSDSPRQGPRGSSLLPILLAKSEL
jgi:hypothetical protein